MSLPREVHALVRVVLELPREQRAAGHSELQTDAGSWILAKWLKGVEEDPVILGLLLEEVRRLGEASCRVGELLRAAAGSPDRPVTGPGLRLARLPGVAVTHDEAS